MKKEEAEKTTDAKTSPKAQLTLPLFQTSESMPVLMYLGSKIKEKPFRGKTLLILLHFLKDLYRFQFEMILFPPSPPS